MEARIRALLQRWRSSALWPKSPHDKLLVLVCLGMFAYRFANLRVLPFINDEAHFLAAAHADVLHGTWASVSPIAGTQGVRYGPAPIWFYRAVQTVFGARPQTSIIAMGLVLTLAQITFAASIANSLKGGARLFAVTGAFIASSPYQFFWSRLAWDPLTDAISCLIVAVLVSKDPLSAKKSALLGILTGIALSSHPMIASLIASTAVVLFVAGLRSIRKLARAAVIAAVAVAAVSLPFALHVSHEWTAYSHSTTRSTHVALATYLSRWLEPARVSGVSGIEYFFDQAWPDFASWCGEWQPLLRDLGAPLLVAMIAATGLIVGGLGSKPSSAGRRLAAVGLLAWFGHAAFIASRGVEPHPHYQFPAWWVVPAGIASMCTWLRVRAARVEPVFECGVWMLTAIQFAFIVAWMSYVGQRTGTNGIHYGTPVLDQERAVAIACAGETPEVSIENATRVFPVALDYVVSVTPSCADKRVRVCNGGCGAAGGRLVRLRYANSRGGALALDQIRP